MSMTIYEGKAIRCLRGQDGVVELIFDLQGESINKFNALTLGELKNVVDLLKQETAMKGLLLMSGKDAFIVGADITEFLGHFEKGHETLLKWIREVNATFSAIEDLNVPVAALISGFALGGGLEVALTAHYRILAKGAKVGLPETQLGIIPGWGGTVRLPRLIGADNAIEWIASGKQWDASDALKFGAIDAIVDAANLKNAGLALLKECWEGKRDWKARRQEKVAPLTLNATESMMVFEGGKGFVAAMAGPNYPAPVTAVEVMQKCSTLNRDEALMIESEAFVKIALTPVATNLVKIFLGDQYLKKEAKRTQKLVKAGENVQVKRAAVLGAGIMGGGIAYQSASRGVPVLMKDIRHEAVELGYGEATKLLKKRVDQGKMSVDEMGKILSGIQGTLSYGDIDQADIVVEAVVENLEIKQKVLKETEGKVRPGTIMASNTSTISITKLAEGLAHPENFCGMHFFNPVHKMPLVEVIRGKKSSDKAIAATVAYAETLGKKPIVVNDCPGFLVNRVLFPYFIGFIQLVNDGVDYQRIDKVMEKFGWPMGPAYLLDVVGMDTCYHAISIMAKGFPDRMDYKEANILEEMFKHKRFGQKNMKGFFQYKMDKQGRLQKEVDPETNVLISGLTQGKAAQGATISDEEIVERMMLPMVMESARCLDEKIVASPIEVDLGVVYGLGFPPFRGGVLCYADNFGLAKLCEAGKKYETHSPLYRPTSSMLELAKKGQGFYSAFAGKV